MSFVMPVNGDSKNQRLDLKKTRAAPTYPVVV